PPWGCRGSGRWPTATTKIARPSTAMSRRARPRWQRSPRAGDGSGRDENARVDPAPSGGDRAQARPHARRATDPQHPRRHRLFGAPGQSPKEGLKEKELAPGYAAALVGPGPKEQIFGADEPGRGAKRPRSIRLYAMQQGGKGRILLRSALPTCPGLQWLGPFPPPGTAGHHWVRLIDVIDVVG